ncbi:MAG: phospholipase [Planctomycetota bacterium]|nr:MAG: phospholipase [Planctomycetota bacterium]
MRWALAGIMLWGVIAVNSIEAQTSPADRFEKKTFTGKEGGTLGYRFLQPVKVQAGQKYPLVIFLHGAGERGDDNTAQLVHGVPRFAQDDYLEKYPCFVIAPQCPREKIWASTHWSDPQAALKDEPSPPTKLLMELLDSVEVSLPIDKDREYLTGLSMGGYGTWDMAQRQPQRFAAIVPVCGGADVKQMERIKHLPVWIFHGDQDQAVKVERSREAVAALQAVGAKPIYSEYPGVGHDSWNKAYADEKLYEWLFRQKRIAK